MQRIGFGHLPSHAMSRIILILLIINILCLAEGSSSNNNYNNNRAKPSQFSMFSRSQPKQKASACNGIPYVTACETLVLSLQISHQSSPQQLFHHSVHFIFQKATSALQHASIVSLSQSQRAQDTSLTAGDDCVELLEDTLDLLSNIIKSKKNPKHTHSDIHTWLSAALTNQQTCIESLQNDKSNNNAKNMILISRNLSQHISNSLALYVTNYHDDNNNNNNAGRKLLFEYNDKFPAWVSATERKLLETPGAEIKADAVVAKDGSGTHKSVGEAIAAVMQKYKLEGEGGGGGGGRNVIYVKAGTYHENIKLTTKQKNVMLVGDGKGKSVIVGSRSNGGGYSTFQTATVSVMGDGFIAKDLTIVNSAGPGGHQAVALRVASDKSVIYQCSLQGYQDTLYTHSKRQFYRDTDIYGTIDFIFGNSAVVLQNCNIFARKPSSERNFVTAQGRTDPNQNTGISIHNCKISSESGSSTYLGRPWQKYARVVIMQSFLDGSIHPAGWYPWAGGSSPSSVYYAEYSNSGSGASVSGRVHWPGYKGLLSSAAAQAFTVASFIDGNMWLPSTGVSFNSGLVG